MASAHSNPENVASPLTPPERIALLMKNRGFQSLETIRDVYNNQYPSEKLTISQVERYVIDMTRSRVLEKKEEELYKLRGSKEIEVDLSDVYKERIRKWRRIEDRVGNDSLFLESLKTSLPRETYFKLKTYMRLSHSILLERDDFDSRYMW